jgi:hypothetical protein
MNQTLKCTMKKRFSLFSLIYLLLSCSVHKTPSEFGKNDTTKAISIGLLYASSFRYMPDAPTLKSKNDSFVVTSTILPLKKLVFIGDSMRFKIISKERVCELALNDKNFKYLDIKRFIATDTSFDIGFESLTCDSFMSGGALFLHLTKKADSIFVSQRSSWSIN